MAYYRDLDRCSYFDRYADSSLDLTAVGWLEAPLAFPNGKVPREFERRLFELVDRTWDPIRFRGKHACDLCTRGPDSLRSEAGRAVDIGATNLFIPKLGDVGFFVAPSLILHYVIDHGYRPPLDFQSAVLACPDCDSSAYFRRAGRIIPSTVEWRDGQFGYWNSMGAAIAAEAGLMSRAQYDSYFEVFYRGRSSFSAKDLAIEAPQWFSTRYLEPLYALLAGLERQGESDDVRAVRAWTNSVAFLGRNAPSERADAG